MIRITNLSKQYGVGDNACVALQDINLIFPDKKFISINGKSGSGKTTILNMLGMIDKPDSGTIEVDGKDITKSSKKEVLKYRRETVGIIFQFFNLIPVLTCRDNILIANEYAPHYDKDYFKEIVDKLDIGDLLHKYPEQLSGGQQQRIAIARALINKPKIVLADEPTGNLDSENSKNVVELLKNIATQFDMTLIMVTHDEDIAKQADICICITDGKIGCDVSEA